MSIEVEPNPDNSPIDTVIKRLYERSNTKALDVKAATVLEQTTVAGTVVYKTTILPGSTDFHMLLPHNKKVYHFALLHDLGPIESDPKAITIFFQMLETFQISPSGNSCWAFAWRASSGDDICIGIQNPLLSNGSHQL